MLKNAIIAAVVAFFVLFVLNAGLSNVFTTRIVNKSKEAATIASSFNNASIFKIRIAEFYGIHGRLPDTNQELGIGEPDTHTDRWIKTVTVGPLGLIDIALKDIGDEAHIYLQPSENLSETGPQTRWQCYARGLRQVALDMIQSPACTLLSDREALPALSGKPATTTTIDDLVNAVYARRGGLIKSLLARDINVNSRNQQGESPLRAAIERGDHNTVKDLIAAGANVNEVLPGQERITLLMHAMDRRSYAADKIRALIAAGAKLEARDASGKTPLMYAAIADDSQAARVLLHSGADLTAIDNKGQTAENYASLMHGGRSNILRLLVKQTQKSEEFIYRLPE